jgi:hypothetical protein
MDIKQTTDPDGAAPPGRCPVHGDEPCLRWFGRGKVFGHPTATDALQYAEQRFADDPGELADAAHDARVPGLVKVRSLLEQIGGDSR